MPRTAPQSRRKPSSPPPPPVDDRDDDDLPQDEIHGDDFELVARANELSQQDGATVSIYRQGIHGRDLRFIDTVPPANFSMVMLKHAPYGGGKFRIQMRNTNGELVLNRLQEVEPGPKVSEPLPLAVAPVAQAVNTGEAFVLLAKSMSDGFLKLGELIVANRPEPVKPRSTTEILAELSAMKSLFNVDRPAVDPLETVTRILGVMKEMPFGGGGDGGEPGPMAVLLELAKQFGPRLMEAQAQANALEAPPQPPVHDSADVQPRIQSVQSQTQRKPDVNFIITQQLKFLTRQAARNNDPEPYAVMVLDNVPPPVLQQFLDRPDWFAEICRYAPDAAPYEKWFADLRACIDEYLTEEPADAQTGAAQSADGGTDGPATTGEPSSNS